MPLGPEPLVQRCWLHQQQLQLWLGLFDAACATLSNAGWTACVAAVCPDLAIQR